MFLVIHIKSEVYLSILKLLHGHSVTWFFGSLLPNIFIQQGSSTPLMPFYPVKSIFPSSLSRYISFFTRKTSSVVPEKIKEVQDSDNNKNNKKVLIQFTKIMITYVLVPGLFA